MANIADEMSRRSYRPLGGGFEKRVSDLFDPGDSIETDEDEEDGKGKEGGNDNDNGKEKGDGKSKEDGKDEKASGMKE